MKRTDTSSTETLSSLLPTSSDKADVIGAHLLTQNEACVSYVIGLDGSHVETSVGGFVLSAIFTFYSQPFFRNTPS